MKPREIQFTEQFQQFFGANTEVFVFGDEQTQLVREVEIRFVVGSRGQQDTAAIVRLDVCLDRLVDFALTVSQVVRLVQKYQFIAFQVGQFAHRLRCGDNLAAKPVGLAILLPHFDEVLRTQDQGFHREVVLEHPRQGGRHHGFAESDDIADNDAAALVKMPCRDLYCRRLIVEQFPLKYLRQLELCKPCPRLLRQVVRHFEVDMVRRDRFFSRPRFLDHLYQIVADVQTPFIRPPILEPFRKFRRRVTVQNVDVQFALSLKPRKREVRTPHVSDNFVYGVGRAMEQVQFRVQVVLDVELYLYFS